MVAFLKVVAQARCIAHEQKKAHGKNPSMITPKIRMALARNSTKCDSNEPSIIAVLLLQPSYPLLGSCLVEVAV